MADKRSARINEEFMREIGDIIHNGVKDPGVSSGMVSVLHVDVTRDLAHAKIRVSVYGTDKQKDKAVQALERASGFIRSELSHRITMRRVPELHFILDDSIEYAVNISRKIDKAMEDTDA